VKTHLVVHHSATRDSKTYSWPAIRRYHMKDLGWLDIGYHYGVELGSNGPEMLVGRPLLARAAAAYQERMNVVGVHVCFVGNYDEAPHPMDLIAYAAPRLADICELLEIPLNDYCVIGHRDVEGVSKSCPGDNFDMNRFRRTLRGAL
jgi:N-acetylmuramoyl-L-alanine amidase